MASSSTEIRYLQDSIPSLESESSSMAKVIPWYVKLPAIFLSCLIASGWIGYLFEIADVGSLGGSSPSSSINTSPSSSVILALCGKTAICFNASILSSVNAKLSTFLLRPPRKYWNSACEFWCTSNIIVYCALFDHSISNCHGVACIVAFLYAPIEGVIALFFLHQAILNEFRDCNRRSA